MHQPSGIYSLQTAKDMPNLNKIQNYAARWVHHDYSHCTVDVSLPQTQPHWPPLSVPILVLFCKIFHQNIAIPIPPYLQILLRTVPYISQT